ncbi:AT-rich interactive domain-containing protein 1A isoform X1 [Lates japonicus]|uniref:AT-rich interactive domain-containing protein 1A isoform X1 n=1 Tax=Lates japonicus TaxID=270547 RepID=A0AAD3MKE2_LATJO|nr:AT-rich interactive domain-containing protein 1A isoform X1 [Lates japonicus]
MNSSQYPGADSWGQPVKQQPPAEDPRRWLDHTVTRDITLKTPQPTSTPTPQQASTSQLNAGYPNYLPMTTVAKKELVRDHDMGSSGQYGGSNPSLATKKPSPVAHEPGKCRAAAKETR